MADRIRLTDIFELPVDLSGLEFPVGNLWDDIGVTSLTQTSPSIPPDGEPETAIGEWQAWLLTDRTLPSPDKITLPPDRPDTETWTISVQLELLGDLRLQLTGLAVLSFGLIPGTLGAVVTVSRSGASVDLNFDLVARFESDLLRPMRQVAGSGGPPQFAVDTSRTYFELTLNDVRIAIATDGTVDFDPGHASYTLPSPVMIGSTDLVVHAQGPGDAQLYLNLSGEDKCLIFSWSETYLKDWLRRLSPALVDQGAPSTGTITARVVLDSPIKEIVVDWNPGQTRTFGLPGFKIDIPPDTRFSLFLGAGGEGLHHLALVLTLPQATPPGKQLVAYSTFAWGRDGDRELHNDDSRDANAPPLFTLELGAKKEVSLVLLEMDIGAAELPHFFRELQEPLPDFEIPPPGTDGTEALCAPLAFNGQSLQESSWDVQFKMDTNAFKMPFLNQPTDRPSSNQFNQFLQIRKPADLSFDDIEPDFETKTLSFPVEAELKIGPLSFATGIEFKFNWETFALDVDHSGGIDLLADEREYTPGEHLGLTWRLKGSPAPGSKYHYFTLVTQDYHYQIQQAPGTVFELEYTKASREPIIFAVTDFVLSAKGISLVAEVTDRPARLNGLDTRFRFHGSRLEITENRIKDFTLAGSGPLPPALVGDATADIALQFSQRDGGLTLVAGSAQLQGNKLLDCKGTRFQFSIDALGLKFVNDGRFHLYFTLTGTAQFVLAPGDDRSGALALLPNIQIDLIECPLTGDASVIAKHVKFLVELPKPVSFKFLGCFEMELRGIGFVPQAEQFDGDGAMQLTGQLKFAQDEGDVSDPRTDYHNLLIGLPQRGSFVPRIYFKRLAVNLSVGEAFSLNGYVNFLDEALEQGFEGEGVLQIQGLPTIAASFAFLRVRRDEQSSWLRAWFIFLEARQVSFMIPKLEIYLREIGLGFGYRFTIASIRATDRANDVRELLAELNRLSRTQGDLSRRDRWSVDLEDPGESVRWTIVLRALFAQSSASPSPLKWMEDKEEKLPCVYLFDAVIALRSDLTFFMAMRGWFNTNYYTFVKDADGTVKEHPLFSGFVLLSPRQKRLLAHMSSNSEGYIGDNPPLPDFAKEAIRSVQFSATLLIEPGLMHFELGWPNMLRWVQWYGPLRIEQRGGFIFRITRRELVMGISYRARGHLSIQAELDLGLVGVRVSAIADVAFGARLIGLIKFYGSNDFFIYGAIGLEMRIVFSIEFWIRIPLIFTSIKLSFGFSLSLGFTAGLELGMGPRPGQIGVRGCGTLSVSVMGHSLHVSAKFGINESVVTEALSETRRFMNIGLEATDFEPVPGLQSGDALVSARLPGGDAGLAVSEGRASAPTATEDLPKALNAADLDAPLAPSPMVDESGLEIVPAFKLPNYSVFVIRQRGNQDDWGYFVLLPKGESQAEGPGAQPEAGFLPAPPLSITVPLQDDDLIAKLNGQVVPQIIRDELSNVGVTLSDPGVEMLEADLRWKLVDGTREYLIRREDTHLKVTLVVENDFILTLPTSFPLFSLDLALRDDLDDWAGGGALSQALKQRFRDNQVTLSDTATIGQVAGESAWLITDGGLQYRIVEEFDRLNVFGGQSFEQFDPQAQDWVDRSQQLMTGAEVAWKVNWDAVIFGPDKTTAYDVAEGDFESEASQIEGSAKAASLTLADYLNYAYPLKTGTGRQVLPDRDPDYSLFQADGPPIEDERVHNPSDNSFEAAVRGAVEQFRGSPFFKQDPNYEYDAILNAAFQDNTTIYHSSGQVPDDPDERRETQENQQAIQLRGMVIHDLITALRAYAAGEDVSTDESIAFQMGLLFRFKGRTADWLDDIPSSDEQSPNIQQRLGPDAVEPHDDKAEVITFNVVRTDFSKNPPQFQRVQQFTDASTIAITWDLVWPDFPQELYTATQGDPEHHLVHYRVQQRALDGREREVVYTVKNAQPLHREDGGLLKRLKPRFRVVDHFSKDTVDDLAALPATGRSYLYTITPIDFAGNVGRPLTLVATRYPNLPPQVPVDGELVVAYRLAPGDFVQSETGEHVHPRVVTPHQVHVEWTVPRDVEQGSKVPVAHYRLIFRQDPTLPIGSYGLDSTTQGPRAKLLPTTNARPLPTDVKIKVKPITNPASPARRLAVIELDDLRAAGVLPPAEAPDWRPESWRVFLQTVSVNDVPSALAPVQLLLRVEVPPAEQDAAIPEDVLGLLDRREERRPAELEWLAHPLRFPMLPPEDQRAIPGVAHCPMPTDHTAPGQASFRFDGTLANVGYRRHPAGIRCLRFRWNQGPSGLPDYPLDLNAGYEILELDTDAQTIQTFEDPERLAQALRTIQEVQMLPAGDMLLTPGDTLTTSQWEAWYPSAVKRLRPPDKMAATGSQIAQGPWYSWRESLLEWPPSELPLDASTDMFDQYGERIAALHPALQHIIDLLDQDPAYTLDPQISPPIKPASLDGFIEAVSPKTDPYGWGVLQRFGLAVGFSLRDAQTGQVIHGQDLLDALKVALDDSSAVLDSLKKHLFVEVPFQAGRSVDLQESSVVPEALLATVQISLRPAIRQYLYYGKMRITGAAKSTVELGVQLASDTTCSLIDQSDPASGQVELEPDPTATTPVPVRRMVTLPLNGATTLLLRSVSLPTVQVSLPLAAGSDPTIPDSIPAGAVEFVPGPPPRLVLKAGFNTLDAEQRQALIDALGDANAGHAATLRSLTFEALQPFAPTDELAPYFIVPSHLAEHFSDAANADGGRQWRLFRKYAEGLNGPDDPKIAVPVLESEIDKILPKFLEWTQRFFDANGLVGASGETGVGPWLATAYPRTSTPAYATPDESGRLKYNHLFEDQWAHNYRYYIRPYGRYDLLWRSLRESPVLFPDRDEITAAAPVTPDPMGGGLDVVLDRLHPVDAPLILSSSRLDAESRPGQPVPPGSTWEVIVAQHPEQTLSERNQTVARQLAFRQVAFTLLRRFSYGAWVEQLRSMVNDTYGHPHEITTCALPAQTQPIPGAYPHPPKHIDFERPVPDDVARSLALPKRIGAFQQGALVLQWERLPFYYAHRLLVIAQTASTVSSINEVVQQDFEYRSPDPAASGESIETTWTSRPPFSPEDSPAVLSARLRRVEIPLRRFWDSLPPCAQQQWASEEPGPDDVTGERKYSALPDPEVVYQIVELFNGNIEVQTEFFFEQTSQDGDTSYRYSARQLGKHFFGQVIDLLPPLTQDNELTDFLLVATLQQISEIKLVGSYDGESVKNQLPVPTKHKVALQGQLLAFAGILTEQDRAALLTVITDAEDQKAIEGLYLDWYSIEPISEKLAADNVPTSLAGLVDFPDASEAVLRWTGTLSDAEEDALGALDGDEPFKEAIARLIERVKGNAEADINTVTLEKAPSSPARRPTGLTDKIQLVPDAVNQNYIALRWTGLLFDDEKAAQQPIFNEWAQVPDLKVAIEELMAALDARTVSLPLPPARPLNEELPDILRGKLDIGDAQLAWIGATAPRDAERTALNDLTGDAAFLDAVQRLKAAYDADHTVPIVALPPTLAERLIIGDESLTWRGPAPTDRQRADLLNLSGDPDFMTALGNLLVEIDADHTVPLPQPAPPVPDPLPASLRDRLVSAGGQLIWRGPAPTDQQRADLLKLSGDPDFVAALNNLLAEIDTDKTVPMVPLAWPQPEDLPASIRDRLQIGVNELTWIGPAPTDAERAILESITGEPALVNLVNSLLSAIDASRSVPMEPVERRTRPGDLPHSLQPDPTTGEGLTIEPDLVTWIGRIHNQQQLDALQSLPGDEPFLQAIDEIEDELTNTPVAVSLLIPIRLKSKDLPPELIDKLLIAEGLVRYHGLMTRQEGRDLRDAFALSTDRQAIERLFAASMAKGLRGRELKIQARRGSAAPSTRTPLESKTL